MSPIMSSPRRSDPVGSAHATSGIARSAVRNGSAIAAARPSAIRGMSARRFGSAARMRSSTSGPTSPRMRCSAAAAARSAVDVAPVASWIAASCGSVTASDS